jgi:hypothetical protein
MTKPRYFLSALCIGCTLLNSATWATTVEPGQGDLSINRGQGFKPVKSSANAQVGDSVMVGPGGSATVVYEDGCKVNVQPGTVTTIAPLSPCASGSNALENDYCRPDQNGQTHDCWTPATTAFAVIYAGWLAWIIWEITHHHGGAQGQPMSNQ